MGIPTRLVEYLSKNKTPHEVMQHAEAFTAQELTAIEHVKGRHHAKVVMVKAEGETVMAVLPADHRLDLVLLGKIIGKRAALAAESEFESLFPDCARGAMPPFGNLYDVPTFVDTSLTQRDFIVFEAGTHTDAIKMSYADYERLVRPKVGGFAVKLSAPAPGGS